MGRVLRPRPRTGRATLEHSGDPTYAAHVRHALGLKTTRAWKVTKAANRLPIDCVAAGATSAYGCAHLQELLADFVVPWVGWD